MVENENTPDSIDDLWLLPSFQKSKITELLHIIGAYQQNRFYQTWCLCNSTMMKGQNIIPEESDIEKCGEQKNVFS